MVNSFIKNSDISTELVTAASFFNRAKWSFSTLNYLIIIVLIICIIRKSLLKFRTDHE